MSRPRPTLIRWSSTQHARRFLPEGVPEDEQHGGCGGRLCRGGSRDRPRRPHARPAPSWVHRPMRWAQLTLVEDDPGKFDSRFWLDYFRRTHSDAVCLSAGGCVAFYPTEVLLHHRSRWLGNRDVFGELVKGYRDLGMVVLARTDPLRASTAGSSYWATACAGHLASISGNRNGTGRQIERGSRAGRLRMGYPLRTRMRLSA